MSAVAAAGRDDRRSTRRGNAELGGALARFLPRVLLIAAAFGAVGSLGLASVAPVRLAADEPWLTDLDAAKERAAVEGKSILVDFTGSDWCIWCIRLDQEVFATEAFVAAAPEKFVLVKLDFPRDKSGQSAEMQAAHERWSTTYAVSAFPTVLLLDEQGRPFASTGYREGGPDGYLQHLDELLAARTRRDEAFAKASAAAGTERAQLLDQAIADLDPSIVDRFYAEVIEEIGTLDPDDAVGLRTKYFAARDRERQQALLAKVELAARSLEIDRALETIDQVLQEERIPSELRRQMLLQRLGALKRAERIEAQLETIDSMLAIEGLDAETYEKDFVMKAYALVACDREDDAIAMLGDRIGTTLRNRELYRTRAELLARIGRFDQALEDYGVVRAAAQREPEVIVETVLAEADCLLELEREDEAIAAIRTLLERKDLPNESRVDVLIEQAMILRELGRDEQAVEAEDAALALTTDARRRAALLKVIESLRDKD